MGRANSNATSPPRSPQSVPSFAPPPPLVGAAASPSVGTVKPRDSSKRGALLGDIRKGAKLRKTVTNDRSAPRV